MTKKSIKLDQVIASISAKRRLEIPAWNIESDSFWAVLGANASGKSAIGLLLTGELDLSAGSITGLPEKVGYVSFEKHAAIIDREIKNNDTDYMDRIDPGTLVGDYITGNDGSPGKAEELATLFGIGHLFSRGLRFLSTGEIRKTILCQSLMNNPELLILDEPFDGLDKESQEGLTSSISLLHNRGTQILLILNRFSEIPKEVTHIAYMSDCQIKAKGEREEMLRSDALKRLHDFHHKLPKQLPTKDETAEIPVLDSAVPLVVMKEVTVRYDGVAVLDKLNWQVNQGEHWKITGPNGAGKSTLLSLVNGDNPQAYCNDIILFGRKRGTGESIWDIKKHTGIVSSKFQLDYRVSSTVQAVVVSGFFDSIGVYDQPTPQQLEIVSEWLTMIDMNHMANRSFRELSYGEQRMVLIVRAMVKHPHLLILDEPCQGLDEINRNMVLKLVDHIGQTGESTILYVTHHEEDRLNCITNHLRFEVNNFGKREVSISSEAS